MAISVVTERLLPAWFVDALLCLVVVLFSVSCFLFLFLFPVSCFLFPVPVSCFLFPVSCFLFRTCRWEEEQAGGTFLEEEPAHPSA